MTKDEALPLALAALTYCEALNKDVEQQKMQAIIAIKEALAQPDYRAVKTYHEGKPVYVSQTEFPPECKTVAEQTAYAFGWWKALESVRTEQPAQEPVGHRVGFWCADLTCNKCYSAEFRFKHIAPQQRQWVGLTDAEKQEIYRSTMRGTSIYGFSDAIEAKLKEKNFV